ncbi:hypothetical protein Efla_004052 [Eimeria flavescens]
MTRMLFPYIGKGVVAYFDGLLFYSKDVESHANLLKQVLKILEEIQMYSEISTYHFGCSELKYLGFAVSGKGVSPSKKKARAIEIWPETLCNDAQVMQFLGTVNYCRMSMGPDFAEVARPLMDLMKKGQPYIWEGKHAAAVRALKHRLLKCNVLQIPERAKPYVLKSDASAFAIGAVLEQDEKPLCFLSKKMSETDHRA